MTKGIIARGAEQFRIRLSMNTFVVARSLGSKPKKLELTATLMNVVSLDP